MSHNIATRYNIDSNLFFQNLELQQGFYVRSERLRGTVTSNSISLNKIYLGPTKKENFGLLVLN